MNWKFYDVYEDLIKVYHDCPFQEFDILTSRKHFINHYRLMKRIRAPQEDIWGQFPSVSIMQYRYMTDEQINITENSIYEYQQRINTMHEIVSRDIKQSLEHLINIRK